MASAGADEEPPLNQPPTAWPIEEPTATPLYNTSSISQVTHEFRYFCSCRFSGLLAATLDNACRSPVDAMRCDAMRYAMLKKRNYYSRSCRCHLSKQPRALRRSSLRLLLLHGGSAVRRGRCSSRRRVACVRGRRSCRCGSSCWSCCWAAGSGSSSLAGHDGWLTG